MVNTRWPLVGRPPVGLSVRVCSSNDWVELDPKPEPRYDVEMREQVINNLSVMIVDDHQLVGEILAKHLNHDGGFVAETTDSLQSALDIVAQRGSFDVILLDLGMPGMNGLEGLSRFITANAGKPVAILSGNLPPATVAEAMRLGAASCIPKTLSARALINAVRFVATGETFVLAALTSQGADTAPASDQFQLSRKERQVLKELCLGQANKEIARKLSLSEVTIKMHLRSICTKLGAKNRTQAVIIATEKQIL